jgi:hypothetical protein
MQAIRSQSQTCGWPCIEVPRSPGRCRRPRSGSACRMFQSRGVRCPCCAGRGIALSTLDGVDVTGVCRHTRRQLGLPLALCLLDWVLRVVRHAGAAKKCTKEGDVWHGSVDGALGGAECARGVRTDKGGRSVADGVERADNRGDGWEAHEVVGVLELVFKTGWRVELAPYWSSGDCVTTCIYI